MTSLDVTAFEISPARAGGPENTARLRNAKITEPWKRDPAMGELLQKRDTKNLAETWHENQPPIVIKSMSPSWRGELFGLIPIDFMSAPTAIETCVAVAQAAPVVKSPYKMISFCVIIGPFKLTTKRVLAQFS